MPELPDLQVFSRNLDKQLSGKALKEVRVVNDSKLKISPKELKDALEGQELIKVYREGKELHFEFKNGNVLGLHLMLNGNLYLFTKTNEHKNTIIELLFNDDTGLALTDYQGMATPTLNPEKRSSPDALSKEVDYNFLKEKLETKTAIKTLLLDQKVIRGIGNAYADEILWDARISPFSASNKIPGDKIKVLAKSIKSVLLNAEKQILKTHPDIISGEVRDFLDIHNARKTHSPDGAVIHNKMVSSRKTYYTDEQELYK
ncbi:MAG: DNA-formamidopyrimidine glycosylase [Segetibacter sp.]|nr:DNA-formamidopyrimidine glycosylase [Segetibacter sp.]